MKGGVKSHGIFSMSSDKMRSKGDKLEYRTFPLNTGKHFGAVKVMEPWHRLPRYNLRSLLLGDLKIPPGHGPEKPAMAVPA